MVLFFFMISLFNFIFEFLFLGDGLFRSQTLEHGGYLPLDEFAYNFSQLIKTHPGGIRIDYFSIKF